MDENAVNATPVVVEEKPKEEVEIVVMITFTQKGTDVKVAAKDAWDAVKHLPNAIVVNAMQIGGPQPTREVIPVSAVPKM